METYYKKMVAGRSTVKMLDRDGMQEINKACKSQTRCEAETESHRS